MTLDGNITSTVSPISTGLEVIINIVIYLVIPLTLFYVENTIRNKYLSDISLKKTIFKDSILPNESVRTCIEEYKATSAKSDVPDRMHFNVSLALGVVQTIYVLSYIVYPYISAHWFTIPEIYTILIKNSGMPFVSIILLFIVFYSTILKTVTKVNYGAIDNMFVQNKYMPYKSNYYMYHSFFIICTMFIFILAATTKNLPVSLSVYKNMIIIFCIILILLLFIIGYTALSRKKEYNEILKQVLNEKHKTDFPVITVSTSGNQIVKGKIENVFNENSITLRERDITTIVMWSSVDTIQIENKYSDSKQKQISDY